MRPPLGDAVPTLRAPCRDSVGQRQPPRRDALPKPSLVVWIASLAAVASLAATGCSGPIECKTEITNGSTSFNGAAVGKAEDAELRKASVREACRQKCADEKAAMIDACTATCVTDVSAQKLGAKTTCGRK